MITVTSGVEIFISIMAISFFQQGVLTDTDGVFGRFNDISAVTVGMGGRREYWISVLEMVVKLITMGGRREYWISVLEMVVKLITMGGRREY